MSELFFEELGIPNPDTNLEVGSSSHAIQTAEVMKSFEKVCLAETPGLVVVFGDINSTIACALVARKMGIMVAHVEAGLRSGDMSMPEEINRILTDHISNLLFTTSEVANNNLAREGIDENKIFFVGNVMIDTLNNQMPLIENSTIMKKLNLKRKNFDLLTLHRPSNVDDTEKLLSILSNFDSADFSFPIVFPAHPRTKLIISEMKAESLLERIGISIINPLGYNDFLNLQMNSRSVWTDSGGIQEETTWLGVPCFTIRDNTERPETIALGTNTLVNHQENSKYSIFLSELHSKSGKKEIPLWDGKSGQRIASEIMKNLI
jgi:UDP-N-acetylglucosamine 2-epimerase (non-hydrolysing)